MDFSGPSSGMQSELPIAKKEVFIDEKRLDLVFKTSYNVPAMQNSIAMIARYLFADGIEISQGDAILEKKRDFDNHLMTYYRRFGEEAIRWILCAGLVPMTICLLKESQEYIPVCVKPGSGKILCTYKNHRASYEFRENGRMKSNTKVVVLGGFGYDPTINGELTSLISSLLPMEDASSIFLDCATMSERTRSAPPFILQKRQIDQKKDRVLGVDYGAYGDAPFSEERDEHEIWRRDEYGIEKLRMMNQRVEEVYYQRNPRGIGYGASTPSINCVTNQNHVLVQEDMEMVKQVTLPQSRADLVGFLQFNNSEVYNTLGIPESMATGTKSSRARDFESSSDLFKTTILWWKRVIASLLTISYNYIYAYDDAEHVLNGFSKKTGNPVSKLSEDAIYAIQKNNKFTVNLPIPPFTTTTELVMFYQQGALTEEEYCSYLRRRANLGPLQDVPFIPPRAGQIQTEDGIASGSNGVSMKNSSKNTKQSKRRDRQDSSDESSDEEEKEKKKKKKKEKENLSTRMEKTNIRD